MKRKYDTNSFVEIVKNLHNNKYDYSKVDYISYHKNIIIICKTHGQFLQKPSIHLLGRGCKKCGYIKNSKRDEFVDRANKIHDFEFDYSEVEYKRSDMKVKIICKKHGPFYQKPQSHLNGQKCMKCKNENDSILESEFIERSSKKFNNKFDYSKIEYVNYKTKIKIICPNHGIFLKSPEKHINSEFGCTKCSIDYRKKFDYIDKCRIKFNNKYDYSLIEKYTNCNMIENIICPEHGKFKSSLKSHYNSYGCPYCTGKKMNTEFFIKKNNILHRNFYDYSITKYKSSHEEVKIICPEHGEFKQKAYLHSQGSGCPKCKTSSGERAIIQILKSKNIEYQFQKTFDGLSYIKNLYFDFYIPSMNLCLEYNGIQHYESIEFFGGDEGLLTIKKRDEIKKDYCLKNNINYLIISYDDDIEKKLLNILNEKN